MPSIVPHPRPAPQKRNLKKVPYVELYAGRLQGVVSSGSSATRVYVSLIEQGTGNFYCSTNNNRPCGGLRGGGCKHLDALVQNAVAQYGEEAVARFLGAERPSAYADPLIAQLGGTKTKVQAAEVFTRFREPLYRLHHQWFPLTPEAFAAVHY